MATLQHPEAVQSIAFHPADPSILVSASLDGVMRLWDVAKGRSVRKIGLGNSPFAIRGAALHGAKGLTIHDRKQLSDWGAQWAEEDEKGN